MTNLVQVDWHPDTCSCILRYQGPVGQVSNDPAYFVQSLQRCVLHQSVAETDIAQTVLMYNQSFNNDTATITKTQAMQQNTPAPAQ